MSTSFGPPSAATFIGIGTLTPAVESSDFRRRVLATRCWLGNIHIEKYQAHFENTNLTPGWSMGLEYLPTFTVKL